MRPERVVLQVGEGAARQGPSGLVGGRARAVGGGAPQPALDDLDRCDRLGVAEARREQLTRREVPDAEAADRLRDVAALALSGLFLGLRRRRQPKRLYRWP